VLCRIELLLRLLASRTTPIVGQVFESNVIVLCGVIDVTANGADVLARSLLLGEVYFSQMLLMEATFLLRQTSMSITQISDQLHFAEVTTFARFFNRMKGMNPREFRKGK
jgi:AraC-like DNA-binding protein